MPTGKYICIEDKQALIDLVREEISLHKRGELEKLSSNADLAGILECHPGHITRCLRGMDKNDQYYRQKILQSQYSKEKCSRFGSPSRNMTYEQRVAAGKIGGIAFAKKYGSPSRNMTPEQRSAAGKIGGPRGYSKGLGRLSKEQRAENSRRFAHLGGKKCIELYGSPFSRLPEEKRRAISKMGNQRAKELGAGLWGLTLEQRRRNSIINLNNQRKNLYFVEGRFYTQSMEEGAVALMLEKYLPSYAIQEGVNFQVRDKGIKNGGLDFLVDGEFLEWHPVIPSDSRDIPSNEEYKFYKKVVAQLSPKERKAFEQDYNRVLAVNYRTSRQEAVDSSEYAGANVALATNVNGLYDFISKHSGKLPGYEEFKREFNAKVNYVRQFKVKNKQAAEAA